jgi:hypothetical protein
MIMRIAMLLTRVLLNSSDGDKVGDDDGRNPDARGVFLSDCDGDWFLKHTQVSIVHWHRLGQGKTSIGRRTYLFFERAYIPWVITSTKTY